MTGAGGFLQTLVHGYCGLRLQLVQHRFVNSSCTDPAHRVAMLKLIPSIAGIPDHEDLVLSLRGLAFQGRRLHLKFDWSCCLVEIQLVAGLPLCLCLLSNCTWVFDTVLIVGDEPIRRDFQHLCIVSQSAIDESCISPKTPN